MSSSKVCILSLLDAYSEIHERGQNDQKDSTWQLTVARRNKGRHGALTNGVLLPEDVREELRANRVLKSGSCEPLLSDETTTASVSKTEKKSTDALPVERLFVLADAIGVGREQTKAEDLVDQDEKGTTGLRRRKGGNDDTTQVGDKQWSVEEAQDEEKIQEERLRTTDPLEFFGAMPPPELRKAQIAAQKALGSYVEAANLVAAIQQRLQEESKK